MKGDSIRLRMPATRSRTSYAPSPARSGEGMAVEVIALVLGGEEFGTEMPDGAVFLSPVFFMYQVFFTDQAGITYHGLETITSSSHIISRDFIWVNKLNIYDVPTLMD
jgi:hypothetical protein